MINKIISGGQTGADQAALDSAIKFDIPHGGWVPRGRRTENGRLHEKYRMKETVSASYPARTRQNIIDSDGTVIIARGSLTGGSLLTRNMAERVGRPCCCIDLAKIEEFEGAVMLSTFVMENRIAVLNVAGPRLRSDPGIYRDVRAVIEAFLYMSTLDEAGDIEKVEFLRSGKGENRRPSTVDETVKMLAAELTLKTKTGIAHMDSAKVALLYADLADRIRELTGLYTSGSHFFASLSAEEKKQFPQPEDLVMEIVKRLKKHLEKDHILRVVP